MGKIDISETIIKKSLWKYEMGRGRTVPKKEVTMRIREIVKLDIKFYNWSSKLSWKKRRFEGGKKK